MKRMFLIVALIATGHGYAQKAGSKVPNVNVPVYNYSKKSISINDLKGKLVIVVFWGSNCKGCIEAFPTLTSLQKKFDNKIQIILVTSEPKGRIDSIFAK